MARNGVAEVTNVPDGSYRVQFAFGDDLAADCQSFSRRVQSVSQFSDIETFATRYEGSRIVQRQLSYTLYTVENSNARTGAIDIASFNADSPLSRPVGRGGAPPFLRG